jgi:hypothetical protein
VNLADHHQIRYRPRASEACAIKTREPARIQTVRTHPPAFAARRRHLCRSTSRQSLSSSLRKEEMRFVALGVFVRHAIPPTAAKRSRGSKIQFGRLHHPGTQS